MTHPADFRSLCAELADAYLRLLEHVNNDTFLGYEPSDDPLLKRARALLAAPQQGAPSDEELEGLFDAHRSSFGYDGWGLDWEGFNAAMRDALTRYTAQAVPVAIPADEWHDDDGPCLWWTFPIEEPPYSGSPLDSDWPGDHTHFTRIVCPNLPLPEAQP